jgi:hypothetical protein
MKKLLYVILCTIITYSGYTQQQVPIDSHYIFPEFLKGTILMKSGIKNEALLNYNSLSEEMVFDNKGTKLALGQPELIDTIFINGRRFFLMDKKFVELVYKSKYALCVEHKCNIKDPGKPAGYGGTSQTSATTSYSSYLSGGQVYGLKLPTGIETEPYIEYWLIKDGKQSKFLNIRQLSKLFSEKEDKVKEYTKKNDVKFNNQESLVGFIKFLETN